MNNITNTFAFSFIVALIFAVCALNITANNGNIKETVIVETVSATLADVAYELAKNVTGSDAAKEALTEEGQISQEDINLIALVTMAEAEGECEEGKRLVIDTISKPYEFRLFSEHNTRRNLSAKSILSYVERQNRPM